MSEHYPKENEYLFDLSKGAIPEGWKCKRFHPTDKNLCFIVKDEPQPPITPRQANISYNLDY